MAIPFIPGEDQRQLRESVRRWAAANGRTAEKPAADPWKDVAELGWLMAGLPEDAGGLGGTPFDTAIVAEELGRELVDLPFAQVAAAAQLLLDLDLARLADVIAGGSRPIIAHDESGGRGRLDWFGTTAAKTATGYALTGRKSAVVGIDMATALIVSARFDGQVALFWVPPTAAKLTPYETLDRRQGATVLFEAAEVGGDALLASGPKAEAALERARSHALVLEATEALGAMRKALDLTREYVALRRQFGQRIGDFQVIRHVIADMVIEIEQACSIILRGLDALDDPAQRSRLASAVKAKVGNCGLYVGGKGVQLHGGVGMTEEYEIGGVYKRLLVFAQHHGTADDHLRLYAAQAVD